MGNSLILWWRGSTWGGDSGWGGAGVGGWRRLSRHVSTVLGATSPGGHARSAMDRETRRFLLPCAGQEYLVTVFTSGPKVVT